ncbi:MAG: hypothetical protein WD231_00890 [Candidatus Woykebacteria bacterium]
MAVETRYFCTGTCGAVITEEQYNNGLTHCGTNTCTMHKEPFEKGLYCTTCQKRVSEAEKDQHQH